MRFVTEDFATSAGYQLTTHAKEWLGIPPSGKRIKVRYIDIWRIKEEHGERKLAENWVMIDILGVLEQAGYDVKKVLKFVGSKPPEFFDEFE